MIDKDRRAEILNEVGIGIATELQDDWTYRDEIRAERDRETARADEAQQLAAKLAEEIQRMNENETTLTNQLETAKLIALIERDRRKDHWRMLQLLVGGRMERTAATFPQFGEDHPQETRNRT